MYGSPPPQLCQGRAAGCSLTKPPVRPYTINDDEKMIAKWEHEDEERLKDEVNRREKNMQGIEERLEEVTRRRKRGTWKISYTVQILV